ncbi:MAG: GMC family oxidoreductase N-terminal domain-containing protein [Pseudomonadota bacterium]
MSAEQFDYIIVGAGSAGCVLANRLSENPRHKVLLLEAGGTDRRFWVKVPLGYAFTFSDPRVNWRYNADADPGLNNRQAYWPRGRVIGGSSTINAMAYLRGLPNDFDDWEKAGAAGWGWSDIEPVYERLETRAEYDEAGKPVTRGSGPLWVSDLSRNMHPFSYRFFDMARDMGWPVSPDINSQEREGLALLRSTVKDGHRWSSADAFLRSAQKRPNLKIVSHALVERIIIENGRASGVSYRLGEKRMNAFAGRETIISAGAINSPQLLQLSGIGDPELLKSHGINVNHALPEVGHGLQDHLAITQYYRATVPTLNNRLGHVIGQYIAGIQYMLTRQGPLGVPVNQVSGFVRSNPDRPHPDIQIYCNPAAYSTNAAGKTEIDREPGFLLSAQPGRPTSRGRVQITSNDPNVPPAIQPNSLSTQEDRDTAIAASRIVQKMAATPTIAALTRHALEPDISRMNDDELLENFRERAGTVYHPTCTCRMGTDENNSVVDARLRVHGIASLRVADASAFPNITTGNTNAPTIMLGEKGAALILEDASL